MCSVLEPGGPLRRADIPDIRSPPVLLPGYDGHGCYSGNRAYVTDTGESR